MRLIAKVIALVIWGLALVGMFLATSSHRDPVALSTFRTQNLVVDDTATIGGSLVRTYAGNPNGVVTAAKGSVVMDNVTPAFWQNQDGGTVWSQIGAGVNTNHVEIWGDSNAYGNGDSDQLSDKDLVTPYAPVQMNATVGTGLPFAPTHVVANQDLQPFAAPGGANMGYELSLGHFLDGAGRTGTNVGKFACQGADLTRWLPSTGDLWPLMLTYMDARVADWGPIGIMVVDDGTNDAADAAVAAAWQANFTTINTALRQRYGNFLVVFRQTGPRLNNGVAPYVYEDVVRAQQVAYATTDALSILINADDVPLSTDDLHLTANGYELVGYRAATAIVKALGPSATPYNGPMPEFVGAGFPDSGGGELFPIEFPVPYVPSYFDVLLVSTGLVAAAGPAVLSDSAGFVSAGSVTSTFAGLEQNLTLFYRRCSQRDRGKPTISDNNDFLAARIFTFRQPTTSTGTPFDTVTFSANNAFGTAISVTGDTTTGDNRLVAVMTTNFSGGPLISTSAWTNVDLGGFALQLENVLQVPLSNANVLTLATGTKAAAGAFGASTATSSASLVGAYVAVSITP